MSAKTTKASNVDSGFLVKFKLFDTLPLKSFHINCLKQVGIEDPFPDDHTKFQNSINCHELDVYQELVLDNLVYPSQAYGQVAPNCIWIPRVELMFKLMRACVGITDEKDLWLFKEPESQTSQI